MAMTYANIQDRVEQMLQDTSNATYDTTELGMWIEEALKEVSTYIPHIVGVIFKIESRTGTDVTGTTDKLTDSVKAQFVTTDGPLEKVVHNTTDNTWAVVESKDSDSILSISADIMDADESYEIYNIRCSNKNQIYIGDVTDYLWIDSVEYPVGTKRNWKVYGEVLEIGVGSVADSDSTLTNLGNIDVLVRFAKPHRLCQLTDLSGQTHTEAAAGATTIQVKFFTDDEIIEAGDEFHIENHRVTYTVTTGVTLDLQTSSGKAISFYPGLEAIALATEHDCGITFVKSTLNPQHEELFCHLVAARAVLSDNINYINAVTVGGATVWRDFQVWAERRLEETLGKLRRMTPPETKRTWSKD